jgi:hypothetical protein
VEFQGVAGVPFNKPFMTDEELDFIREAYASHYLAGDGKFYEPLAGLARQSPRERALLFRWERGTKVPTPYAMARHRVCKCLERTEIILR